MVTKKPLMTENINMPQGNRIIIGEMLTANNQKLFISAMKLKREKKLSTVYTKNGLVLIKKAADSKPTTIRSSRDLDVIIENNQSEPPSAASNITNIPHKNNASASTLPASTTSTLSATNGQQSGNNTNAQQNQIQNAMETQS